MGFGRTLAIWHELWLTLLFAVAAGAIVGTCAWFAITWTTKTPVRGDGYSRGYEAAVDSCAKRRPTMSWQGCVFIVTRDSVLHLDSLRVVPAIKAKGGPR